MAVIEPGRLAEHFLGDQPDRVAVLEHAVGPLLDGDDGGLVQDDALALDADQRVARAQVDAHVDAEHAQERIEDHVTLLWDRIRGATPAFPTQRTRGRELQPAEQWEMRADNSAIREDEDIHPRPVTCSIRALSPRTIASFTAAGSARSYNRRSLLHLLPPDPSSLPGD